MKKNQRLPGDFSHIVNIEYNNTEYSFFKVAQLSKKNRLLLKSLR